MTENAVVQWDPNSGAALPAYLTDAMGELGSNIADRMTVPSLSYEGKTWTIVKDGNKTKLQAKNEDGDMVPIPVMRMVVLKYNPERGRAYYPGVYNPAESKQPDCWSVDGKAPDDSSQHKQATACNGCPMSIKGSKVQDGKEMVACSSHRMIAIAPAFEIAGDPLRLKIAVTSDWDKNVVEHGWHAFNQYTDFLKSRGIAHTGLVVTKVKFDSSVAYPKLLFALDRLLSPAEVAQAVEALKNPKVDELLAEKWSAAGAQGVDKADADTRPFGLEGAYADGWTAHPDSAGYAYKGQEVVKNEELAARYPEPAPPPLPVEEKAPDPTPAAPAVPASPAANAGSAEPAALHGIAAALADGWTKHPDGDWHYKGDVVEETAKVAALYPAPAPAEPAAAAPPPPPVAPPAPEPEPVLGGLAAAKADGWVPHPDAPGYHYKGSDVKLDAEVEAMYPNAPAATSTAAAPAAPATDAQAAATPAATSSSPSSPPPTGTAELPADVQDMLNKWS